MKTIVLASGSPRRKELLSKIYKEFIIDPSMEEEYCNKEQPSEIVEELAKSKALDVSKRYSNDTVIIGSDTMVAIGHEILGKPKDKEDCYRMIQLISGKKHQVYTGVCIIVKEDGTERTLSFVEKSDVYVSELSDEEIQAYVNSKEPYDKAGGYGIQGDFAIFINKIEGDYNTIVGFPIARIYEELKKLNQV